MVSAKLDEREQIIKTHLEICVLQPDMDDAVEGLALEDLLIIQRAI